MLNFAMPRRAAALALCLASWTSQLSAQSAPAESRSSFAPFEGRWTCEGRFLSSGKEIHSTLSMAEDAPSGALIVHHDDIAPMAYHSLEVWTRDAAGPGLHAATIDKYSGMRVFESPSIGREGLTWTRYEGGAPKERFAYVLNSNHELRIDWSVARAGPELIPGDTLTCRRFP
jgi:hypothetical protein